jgi:hypothetical protein
MSEEEEDDGPQSYIEDAAQNVMYFLRLLEPESYARVYQAIYGCAIGTMVVIAGPMINGARSILHVRVVKKDDDGTFDVEPPLH